MHGPLQALMRAGFHGHKASARHGGAGRGGIDPDDEKVLAGHLQVGATLHWGRTPAAWNGRNMLRCSAGLPTPTMS